MSETQILTEKIKLDMTSQQRGLTVSQMEEFIKVMNDLVQLADSGTDISRFTTADVDSALPSAIENQAIREARSAFKKYNERKKKAVEKGREIPPCPVFKHLCFYVNTQNFKYIETKDGVQISFPVMENGKTHRIKVRSSMTDRQKKLLIGSKPGLLRIVMKNGEIFAQASYEEGLPKTCDAEDENVAIMGIDLGVKCPAVSKCSDGSVRFYGNGRKNRYYRLQKAHLRRKAQATGHKDVVKRIGDKESRYMKDVDHKVSRQIVNEAISRDVKIIKLEKLDNIRKKVKPARKSRKNDSRPAKMVLQKQKDVNRAISSWSFGRLGKMIEYKAAKAGILVIRVNAAYTSQECPVCGAINKADDRRYECTSCGCRMHRDIVGAINIMRSTKYVGA